MCVIDVDFSSTDDDVVSTDYLAAYNIQTGMQHCTKTPILLNAVPCRSINPDY